MAKSGPIVIVEDDVDDQEIITEVIKGTGASNKIIIFDRCAPAFTYLETTEEQPFFILCDINLPQLNGLDFKLQIDSNNHLRQKSIPFVFFSTTDDTKTVTEAYTNMTVQGFFKKCSNMEDLKESIRVIMAYWSLSRHPNSE